MKSAKYLDELLEVILSKKDKESLENFLHAILTPRELEEIPTRLQIVKQLKKEIPQKQIAEDLGVGVATVTRGSKELQKGNFSDIE